jgi:NAD(P)H-dependent FMN reductase
VSAPLRVVAVVGTTRSVSKTKALTELTISRLAAHAEISAEVIEIHALIPGLGAAVEREQLDEPCCSSTSSTSSASTRWRASRCCSSPPAAATGTRW